MAAALPIGRVLKSLSGRYPLTMLGGWQEEGVSPYRHLIGTILSARSRDEMTAEITAQLFRKYRTPRALAGADRRTVERILKPIGFYRTKARYITETAKQVVKSGVPKTLEGLMELPGVGRKVANCVLVFAYGRDAIPVDTHVHRISNRLGWVITKMPEETERALVKIVPRRYWQILNEVFVAHGKAVYRPIGPKCGECSVERLCAKRKVRGAR